MTLPNLVGCGAGKSGTTSLYYYMSQHPDISMAPAKEVHYFSQHYEQGTAWYEKQFAACTPATIVGEFSTSYMLNTDVPQRMAELLPDARLLFIFRNPIDRAYSNYWFAKSIGSETGAATFTEMIHSDAGQRSYVISSLYARHMQRFMEYYPLEHMYVMFTEELKSQPLVEMRKLYGWLAVDADFSPDITGKYNVTVRAKNKFQARVWDAWLETKRAIKPAFMWIPPKFRKRFADIERDVSKTVMTTERPPMSDDDNAYLQRIFKKENQALADLIGRSLPWD